MNGKPPANRSNPPEPLHPVTRIHHLARILLGAFIIAMGVAKVLDPVAFLKLLREYELLASPQPLNSVAALLPWFEIFCGILLVSGILARAAAAITAAMFLAFTIAILHRALAIHATADIPFCQIRFDCGCGSGIVLVCAKVPENLALLAIATWLVFSRHAPHRWLAWLRE